jgi:hypothetical protein
MAASRILLLLLVACNTSPTRTGLRFEVTDADRWTPGADGKWSCSLLGARCAINPTPAPIELRVGPEATRNPTAAIGEMRVLPLGKMPVENVPDYQPYVAQKPVSVPNGSRATFYLDTPLGREPTVGQYLVLVIEARDERAGFERRLLSLVATNNEAAARPAR